MLESEMNLVSILTNERFALEFIGKSHNKDVAECFRHLKTIPKKKKNERSLFFLNKLDSSVAAVTVPFINL